jgi:PAS domain S-box-containing protein
VWFGDLKTMFGIDANTYEGRVEDFRNRVHPDDRELVWRAVADARQNRTPYRAKFRVLRPDGAVRWVDANGAFHFDAAGDAVRMTGIAADITDRKIAEDKPRGSQDQLAEAAPGMLWASGPDKSFTYFNPSWLAFTGRPLEAEVGIGWTEGLHASDLDRCLDIYMDAFDRRQPFNMEYRLRRHDGEYRWILSTGAPRVAPNGSLSGYVGSCLDVTELRHARQTLAEFSHKLIETQENERRSIARELHDDVAQRMALLTIELDHLSQELPQHRSDTRLRVHELRRRAIDLERNIQDISHQLYSSTLEYLGIGAAAGALCKTMRRQHDVEIDFAYDGIPEDLPQHVALGLFRVLQEALDNAVRHAGVRSFRVALRADANLIHLDVSDEGVGFDPRAALRARALGLVGMQERIKLLKGEVAIESSPGKGTIVRARVPFTRCDS